MTTSVWEAPFRPVPDGTIVTDDRGNAYMFVDDGGWIDVTGQVPTTQAEMHVVLAAMPSMTGHPPYQCGHPECTLLPGGTT